MSSISVKNIAKNFGDFKAIKGLSFEVGENRIVGFLGPNGAGKTTTLRMLVGLSKPSGGEINIAGSKVEFGKATDANYKIGYLPELPSMYSWMSGREYLKLIACSFNINEHKAAHKIKELVKLVDLEGAIDRKISTYSGGMKQRLGIAQALINEPKVLIMDEPASALDPIGRKEIFDVIKKLKNNHTILFSTHILSDVDRICDDLIIINKGELVAAAPIEELKAKYSKPILEIEFLHNPKKIVDNIKSQAWVKKIKQDGNQLRIWLADEKFVETNEPLTFLAGQGISIVRFGQDTPQTEDLFVELLGEKS